MRRTIPALFSATVLLSASGASATGGEPLETSPAVDEPDAISYLLVVSGDAGLLEGNTLTLEGVSSVTYFSDRPERVAGHMPVSELVDAWSSSADDFAEDPPNAAFSVLGSDHLTDIVVELNDVADLDGALIFDITIIEGDPPEGPFGAASLFIDDDIETICPPVVGP